MRDGVGPTVRTGQLLCRSRLQQMLVQMPGTSVSLTTLIAATLGGSGMALGQRSGNSMAANTPYTCLNLHNVAEWRTDRLVCCVELYLQRSFRGYIHAVGQKNRMSCGAVMQNLPICLHCKSEQNATLYMDALFCCWPALSHLSSSALLCLCERDKKKKKKRVCSCTATMMC